MPGESKRAQGDEQTEIRDQSRAASASGEDVTVQQGVRTLYAILAVCPDLERRRTVGRGLDRPDDGEQFASIVGLRRTWHSLRHVPRNPRETDGQHDCLGLAGGRSGRLRSTCDSPWRVVRPPDPKSGDGAPLSVPERAAVGVDDDPARRGPPKVIDRVPL